MKSTTPPAAPSAPSSLSPASPEMPSSIDEFPAPTGAVRLLLALDIADTALAQIEADWSLIAQTQRIAPDLVPELVGSALERLQRHTLQVSGVAVACRVPNPLVHYHRRAA